MTHIYSTCALFGCNNPVKNWRSKCCCISHSKSYGAKVKAGTQNQPNKNKEYWKSYYQDQSRLRQKRCKNAFVSWANKQLILEFYKKAKKLTKETGIMHEVDHIIPITNDFVCGLHNEFNLQILTRDKNRAKFNYFPV